MSAKAEQLIEQALSEAHIDPTAVVSVIRATVNAPEAGYNPADRQTKKRLYYVPPIEDGGRAMTVRLNSTVQSHVPAQSSSLYHRLSYNS